MVVFFIILAILFFISSIFFILCLSSLEIQVDNLLIDTENKKYNRLEKYIFNIRLKLFDKITLFKIKIDDKKVKTIQNSKFIKSKIFNKYEYIRDIILKNKKEIFKKENLEDIKHIRLNLKQFNLQMKLCTSDAIITSFIVAIITSVISIALAKKLKKYETSKYKYVITPEYEQKLRVRIKLDCIISIKIVHIINVIYMLIKKRSVEYDERTSNRRTYVCSND